MAGAGKKKPIKKKTKNAAARKSARGKRNGGTVVLVATRKGAWIYRGDAARKSWRTEGPLFLGQIVNHLVLDPRDRRTMLAAASTGHLGPTMFRSTDQIGRAHV